MNAARLTRTHTLTMWAFCSPCSSNLPASDAGSMRRPVSVSAAIADAQRDLAEKILAAIKKEADKDVPDGVGPRSYATGLINAHRATESAIAECGIELTTPQKGEKVK
jgi:hypothetical protein